jgi:outer membrane protein assembly factor BamB
MKYAVKVAAIAAVSLLAITGCGGGGGGGGTSAPSLTVNPARIEVTADGNTSSYPTATVAVTVHNPSKSGTYVAARATGNAIAGLYLTPSGTQGVLTITFKDPSVMGPGTYSDSAQLVICVDSACTQVKSGTEVTIPVVYTVTKSATVSLSANPMTTGAGMPATLTWSSTNAQSCTAAGEWSGTLPSSGSQVVTPGSVGSHTYTLSCANPGAPGQASVTVTVASPLATLSAYPANVVLGKTVTLRWSSRNANSCVASGAWSGSLPPAGFRTLSPPNQGTASFHLVCSSFAASSAPADASVTVGAAPVAPPATAYRMNESHDGVLITSNGIKYPAGAALTWTADLGAPVSFPLIANGMVYVTTSNPDQSYGNRLYGLNAKTGAIVWGPIAIPGVYFGSGLTYDNGRIFVLMFDGGIRAFNASNGALIWTAQLPGYWYSGSPNAYAGTVFVSGNGGLSALDEASGAILWTAASGGTTNWVSPAVSSEGAFTEGGSSCNFGAYDPVNGSALWQSQSTCTGAWGYTPIIKNGIFFGRTGNSLNLFDAATGHFIVQLGSERAPSVTATAVIALNAGTLSSTRLSDRVQTWTFTGDGNLITAPVVVNNTVFVGSGTGNVYGLDVETGIQVWIGVSPLPISADSENGGPRPPSGPTAGENLLIYPAGNSLVAWRVE